MKPSLTSIDPADLQARRQNAAATRQTSPPPRQWDAKLARWLIMPLVDSAITPNHLTTLRLLIGLGSVAALAAGGHTAANIGALLLALSNFVDHTDGELARVSGKSSRIGHIYDIASDVAIHVLLFAAIGFGLRHTAFDGRAPWMGLVAAASIALIFVLRFRIEERGGKSATRQPAIGGLEMEDILYLMPLVTLTSTLPILLFAAVIGAPLYALRVVYEYLHPAAAACVAPTEQSLHR